MIKINIIKQSQGTVEGFKRVRFFGRIQKRICDLRSFGSRCIKGTNESTPHKDSAVPLMRHDPNDLRSQIRFWILPKKRTLLLQIYLRTAGVALARQHFLTRFKDSPFPFPVPCFKDGQKNTFSAFPRNENFDKLSVRF